MSRHSGARYLIISRSVLNGVSFALPSSGDVFSERLFRLCLPARAEISQLQRVIFDENILWFDLDNTRESGSLIHSSLTYIAMEEGVSSEREGQRWSTLMYRRSLPVNELDRFE